MATVVMVALLAAPIQATGAPGSAPEALVIPFRVSEEMTSWATRAVPEQLPPRYNLRRLLDALVGPSELGLRQGRFTTFTAEEAFERREANCASLAYLFVGLARARGLPAFFALVDDRSIVSRRGRLNILEQHLVAAYGPPDDVTLFDFGGRSRGSHHQWRAIPDTTAVAIYYSNRGAESILAGEPARAATWLQVAAALDPESASTWVNLGLARRRLGDPAGAEIAYRTAIRADPAAGFAYDNLSALLRLQGRHDEADTWAATAERMASQDPFVFWKATEATVRSGRFEEARHYAHRALELANPGSR